VVNIGRICNRVNALFGLFIIASAGCGRVGFGKDDQLVIDGSTDATVEVDSVADSSPSNSICASNEMVGAFSIDFANGIVPEIETYATSPARVDFADGLVKVSPGKSAGVAYAGVITPTPMDLRGHRTRVQVVQMVATDKPVLALLAISSAADASIYTEIIQALGNIEIRSWNSGTMMLLLRTPYVASKNHYWQFRESQQSLHIEVSADGNVYENLLTLETPAWYLSARLGIGAGTSQGVEGDLGVAHFDNLIDCK
jgi:hypothetical protein